MSDDFPISVLDALQSDAFLSFCSFQLGQPEAIQAFTIETGVSRQRNPNQALSA